MNTQTQDTPVFSFENLALEGGGIRGLAHLGVLKYFEERGYRSHIKRVAGTSAGSIIALLWALGYTYVESMEIISNINFKDLRDDSFGFVRDARRLFKEYGIFPGTKAKELLESFVTNKGFDKKITFEQLYTSCPIELTVVATNVTSGCPAYFNYQLTPNMVVVDAVRMSISYPFVFTAVKHDQQLYIDGGLYDNFPITFWDRCAGSPHPKTLGILLSTQQQVEREQFDTQSIFKYIQSIWDQVTNQHQLIVLKNERDNDFRRVIEINTGNIKTFDFDINQEQIQQLIDAGYQATKKFFNDYRVPRDLDEAVEVSTPSARTFSRGLCTLL